MAKQPSSATTSDTLIRFSGLTSERLTACERSIQKYELELAELMPEYDQAKKTAEGRLDTLREALRETEEAATARQAKAGKKLSVQWTGEESTRVTVLEKELRRAEETFDRLKKDKKRLDGMVDSLTADLRKLIDAAGKGEGLFESKDAEPAGDVWKGIHLCDVMGESNSLAYVEEGIHTIGDAIKAHGERRLIALVGSGDLTQEKADFLVTHVLDFLEGRGLEIPSGMTRPPKRRAKAPDKPQDKKGDKPAGKKGQKAETKPKASDKGEDAPADTKPDKRKAAVDVKDAKGRSVPNMVVNVGITGDKHDSWAEETLLHLHAQGDLRFPDPPKSADILPSLTTLFDDGLATPAQFMERLGRMAQTEAARFDSLYDGSLDIPGWVVVGVLQFIARQINNTGHAKAYMWLSNTKNSLPRGIWDRFCERVPLLQELEERSVEDQHARDTDIRTARAHEAEGLVPLSKAKGKPKASKKTAKKAAKKTAKKKGKRGRGSK